MATVKRTISAVIVFFLLLTALSGCISANNNSYPNGQDFEFPYTSYKDIPGVTTEEIEAIERLRESGRSFTLGMTPSTEAFITDDGSTGGFSALLCVWLQDLFGIPFELAVLEWDDLIAGLHNGIVDFTGDLTATEERRLTYAMTESIAMRTVKTISIGDLQDFNQDRPLQFGFLNGGITIVQVTPSLDPDIQQVLVNNHEEARRMLMDGTIDAFVDESAAAAAFDDLPGVVIEDFFPLKFSSVSLTAQDPELFYIISVIDKALLAGGSRSLIYLYNAGYQDYIKNKFLNQLTDEEHEFIRNNPIIPVAAIYSNYPVSFYNTRENEWQGIFFDLLDEIERITGLTFELKNDEHTEWSPMQEMLRNREVAFVADLIWTRAREEYFIWPETSFLKDHFALISRSNYRNITTNEILYERVGLTRDTAYTAMFKQWFPGHENTVEYDGIEETFIALENGEVDLVMTTERRLMFLTHYQELTGYKINYLFDQAIDTRFGFHKDEVILCAIIDKALQTIDTSSITNEWMRRTYDYRLRMNQERTFWLLGAAMFLGVLALVSVVLIRSRSEGKRLEKLVAEQTSELVEASEAKSRFIANMSHEIRTPMNVILGVTEILMQDDSFDRVTSEKLLTIFNSGDMLLSIINDLLDLSKIDAGKLELFPVEYDTASLIHDTTAINMMRSGSKSIAFKLHADENLPAMLIGDELRIKQVLNNLLSNAFKYTDEGEVKLSFTIERDGDEDGVTLVVSVSDTGHGMTEEQVQRLFDDYSRFNFEANRTIEGTGLGMGISQNLVRLMNGEILVKSELSKGSEFIVRLPQKCRGSEVLGKELSNKLQDFQLTGLRQLRKSNLVYEPMPYGKILIVDDVESNLFVAKGLMAPYGLSIDTATSGYKAIDILDDGNVYDIVFMDHMMPKMNGFEATKIIRSKGYKEPIIALTANAVVGQSDIFLANGFDDFISKPVDIRYLNAILKKYVRDKQTPEVLEAARLSMFDTNDQVSSNAKSDISSQLAEFFIRDVLNAVETLEVIDEKLEAYDDEDISLFTTTVHAMKTALANVGEMELSALADRLEQAGWKSDVGVISSETSDFISKLRATVFKFTPPNLDGDNSEAEDGDYTYLLQKLAVVRDACDTFDKKVAKDTVADLRNKKWPPEISEPLGTIAEKLLGGDLDGVEQTISIITKMI